MAKPRTRTAPTTTTEASSSSDAGNRLLKARRRTRTYDMPVADPTDALEQVETAAAALRRARALGDATAVTTAQEALAAAREQMQACYQPITLEAVSARVFTDLVKEHPPTEDGQEWDPVTFGPALVAACARDFDLTAEQWAAKFEDEQWPLSERNAITAVALDVNLGSSNERYQQLMTVSGALLRS